MGAINKNKLSYTKIQMYKEIIDINPIPYIGQTYIMVWYGSSLFCVYDYRMIPNFLETFFLNNMNNTVLCYHINNNNYVVSINNNVLYHIIIGKDQKFYTKNVIQKKKKKFNNIVIL